jgi:superfamily II DNA or RNA helicase
MKMYYNIYKFITGVIMNKYKPRDYQEEAIEAIVNNFKTNDRATAVMACGTGKTLVALWVVERMNAQLTIVFMPSLALIKQTIESWREHTSLKNVSFMAICSDDNVIDDTIEITAEECDFKVSTSTSDVFKFIEDNRNQTCLLFCTYQSAKVVPHMIKFDLGIFDEAHKTSGTENKYFRYALDDNNVSIKKRLFLTATPRQYKYIAGTEYNKKIAEYSMDNKKSYGEIVYRLDFAEALKRDIICDYRVIIAAIDRRTINNDMIKYGMAETKTRKHRLIDLAHSMLLLKCYQELAINRTIVFHRTISDSKKFINSANSLSPKNNPEFIHINGKMNSSMRNLHMHAFKTTSKIVIGNARCLAEGVDIPSADMVCFMSPKKSKIDIIQAVGRVMRKSSGKECGYILLPIFIDDQEIDPDDSIENSNYDYIYNVINAIKQYDSTFCYNIGESKNINNDPLERQRRKVHFINYDIDITKIEKAISIIVQGPTADWDTRFEEAKSYYQQYGHLRTGKRSPLSKWLREQRYSYKNQADLFNPQRTEKLKSIHAFDDPLTQYWQVQFEEFKKQLATKKINRQNDLDPKYIKWLDVQLYEMKSKRLTKYAYRHKMLIDFLKTTKLKYLLENKKDLYIKQFEKELKQFKEINGNAHVVITRDKKLYDKVLRFIRNRWRYSKEQLNIIDNCDIPYELYKIGSISMHRRSWDEYYIDLQNYYNERGNIFIKNNDKKYKYLASWLGRQRKFYRNHSRKLLPEQKNKLAQLGAFRTANGIPIRQNHLVNKFKKRGIKNK